MAVVQILLRGGTSAELAASNPVLAAREMAVDTTEHRVKIGDGVTPWTGLPWATADAATVAELEALAAQIGDTVSLADAQMTAVQADPESAFSKANKATMGQTIAGGRTITLAALPAAFGWSSTYPITPALYVAADGTRVGSIGKSALALFNDHSSAYTNPTHTFYVAETGDDTTGAGTQASPWRSQNKAIAALNATASGSRGLIIVAAGEYGENFGFAGGSGAGLSPTRDFAVIFRGGHSDVGAFLTTWFDTLAADATYTNTYSRSGASVYRVVDRVTGQDLQQVATAALANITPGSFAVAGGNAYIRRADGVAPTKKNTRVYFDRSCVVITSHVNWFIGSDDGSTFTLEGGRSAVTSDSDAGTVRISIANPGATEKVGLIGEGASFPNAGGSGAKFNPITVQRWHGLLAAFGSSGKVSAKDFFNVHNESGSGVTPAGKTCVLTVNLRADVVGLGDQVSCNFLTGHDDNVVWLDVAGDGVGGMGGTVRSVGSAKHVFFGTRISGDRGDLYTTAGTTPPTALRLDDTCEGWLAHCYIDQRGGNAVYAAGGAKAHIDATTIIKGTLRGNGTFDTWEPALTVS